MYLIMDSMNRAICRKAAASEIPSVLQIDPSKEPSCENGMVLLMERIKHGINVAIMLDLL